VIVGVRVADKHVVLAGTGMGGHRRGPTFLQARAAREAAAGNVRPSSRSGSVPWSWLIFVAFTVSELATHRHGRLAHQWKMHINSVQLVTGRRQPQLFLPARPVLTRTWNAQSRDKVRITFACYEPLAGSRGLCGARSEPRDHTLMRSKAFRVSSRDSMARQRRRFERATSSDRIPQRRVARPSLTYTIASQRARLGRPEPGGYSRTVTSLLKRGRG
jgi:hypothetical protein